MSESMRRIFTAILIIGVPGAGKTTLLASFARYLWETHKRVLLLYSWDGGAIPTELQALMKQGLIRFWRARTRSGEGLGIETLYLATKGYWPRSINVETGETSPAVEMVPPVTTAYEIFCSKTGERLLRQPHAMITPSYCAACKTLHALGELTIKETVARTKGFDLVGGVAFDGLTSMTGVVLDHMDHARGQGQIGGEKPAFGGIVQSGTIKLGGNNRADIGFGQTRGQQFVNNSLSIPYLVEGPVFTALAMEATDEGGLPIVGPKLPGRAATDEASAWFGNVFEMGKTADEQGREQFTLFLRPFTDGQNRRHLLKTSASPMGLPDKLVDPIGEYGTQANLGLVFRLLDDDLRRALETEVVDAPGLAGTPVDYGEPFQVLPAGQPGGPISPALPTASPVSTTTPMVGGAPAVTPATPPAVAAASAGVTAPPAVVARRRAPQPPQAAAPAPVTPSAPVPEPVEVASGGAPPPPGMKPPQRAPSAP